MSNPNYQTRSTLLAIAIQVMSLLVVAQGSCSGAMMTRWGRQLAPDRVWPEYPRPQLMRGAWLNLNGSWDYALTNIDQPPPIDFEGKILVPFPIESHLSGVHRRLTEEQTLWYRRTFVVPEEWNGQRIKLNFGGVDWATTVYINGEEVGTHRGGYDAFTFDITSAILSTGTNELLVAVTDPTEGDQPRGKQSRQPEGIFYMPSSGIWQTVWLEPVPMVNIRSLQLRPDLEGRSVRIRVMANTWEPETVVECVATFKGREAGRCSGSPGSEMTLPLEIVESWSPDRPELYDFTTVLRRGTEEVDRVTSYFGLRDIRVATDAQGQQRLFLNGEPLFQMGVLDQGFWPDGLYAPPADEAIRFDLETAKSLGFNLIRKHVKVEPARWYYWADRLGLVVWQDMPSGNNASPSGQQQFEVELYRMMEQLANHPSLVMWVLFNEGWGQYDTERLVRQMQAADPTRLINNASGWTDAKVGDVIDLHSYPDPVAPATEPVRACVLGEFGGMGLALDGHKWSEQTWGYQGVADGEILTQKYCLMMDAVWTLQQSSGLSAAVYTQLSDVETECNGFLTYDREVVKVDALQVNQANCNRTIPVAVPMPLPNAQVGQFIWRFSTNAPSEEWMMPGYDASTWNEGPGGFGTVETPGARVGTTWNTPDIWLRREFNLPSTVTSNLLLTVHHDEAAEVYLNGILAGQFEGFTAGYRVIRLSEEAQAALSPGVNLIALHCHQSGGGQYIDVGLLVDNTAK